MKLIACVLLLSAATIHAGPRKSPDYVISTESIDAGGRRTTSASYTNDGGAGGIAGVSTVAAPSETARGGYVAQLYDITGLVLTAPSTNVNETATLQLSPRLTLDDASLLTVPLANVAWSVQSGPLSSISGTGLATAGTVFEDTAAVARGIHLGFTGTLGLTVINVGGDNFGTYSGDGLEDAWQVQFFGLDNPLAAPARDPDSDGFDNRFEFLGQLIPTNPFSTFHWRIEEVPGQPTHRRIIFSPRHSGRTYHLDASGSMEAGSWTELTNISVLDNGLERTVTDLDASTDRRLYRIRILEP